MAENLQPLCKLHILERPQKPQEVATWFTSNCNL